jgi:lysophospholipase L1-like esterase
MAERKAVRRFGLVAVGLYLAAFAVLSSGGALRSDRVVAVAVGLLVAAALLLQLTLGRVREHGLLSRRTRLLIPGAIVVVGAVAVGLWWLGTKLGFLTGGVGLGGVCAMYLGAGQLLAEVRADDARALRRGLRVSVVCALLFAAGLAVCLGASVLGIGAAAAGLLIAPVGLTLVSEGVLREHRSWTSPAALACPMLVLSAAWWLRHGLDLRPSLTVALVAAAFVVVGAIASSTQADVVLVVTIVALFWAATPFGVAVDDRILPAESRRTLIALGDSYISGEGASEFFEGTNDAGRNECRRSPHAYPYLVVEGGHAGSIQHLAFLACSGAETDDVVARAQWRGEPIDHTRRHGKSQLAQLRDLLSSDRADLALVIVSIGGNDAGFADIATACLSPGTCVERGQLWLHRLRSVARDIDQAYVAIRKVVGTKVPVLAVPYPVPISDRPCAYSQLRPDEHRFLHGFVDQLDGAIRQSARDAGFYYLGDIAGVLAREKLRICDAPEADIGVNFVRLKSVKGVVDQLLEPQAWLHNSLHPNENGHRAMAIVLEAWIRSHPDPPAKPDPQDEPGAFVPATLDELMGPAAGSYCRDAAASRPRYCDRGDVPWALTKVAGVVGEATPALLLLVAGWWLLWLPVLELTRPVFRALGGRAASWLFGSGRTTGKQ